ncbi:XRE family transcriptional regulator [bacterium C-53]|nr:XRE family transcriptional regulator [Lachnospiraceae bacterium]NBI04343.1 XRE family transcriptional regulator [Lachnospiraceae bacterium]RKJ08343.1 XRE family transcriptional regulator [bacterium C-53]
MDRKIPRTDDVNEINLKVATVMRNIRKRKGLTQVVLSELSGVSVGSVKRFEKTGNISLASFSRLVIALGLEEDLVDLFNDIKVRLQ